jgi:hypothetical protein
MASTSILSHAARKSHAVAVLSIGARGRLRHYSATARSNIAHLRRPWRATCDFARYCAISPPLPLWGQVNVSEFLPHRGPGERGTGRTFSI